ncbi:hypothetical protein niasHT_022740 [Heterodera trifolii]|uniref:Uncharacterized protein n=1 Tax=Heterodera trifolii TaxID=157864 RepID=A0ABD2K655_9BILA
MWGKGRTFILVDVEDVVGVELGEWEGDGMGVGEEESSTKAHSTLISSALVLSILLLLLNAAAVDKKNVSSRPPPPPPVRIVCSPSSSMSRGGVDRLGSAHPSLHQRIFVASATFFFCESIPRPPPGPPTTNNFLFHDDEFEGGDGGAVRCASDQPFCAPISTHFG